MSKLTASVGFLVEFDPDDSSKNSTRGHIVKAFLLGHLCTYQISKAKSNTSTQLGDLCLQFTYL
jgi:hypothetical protein